MMHCGYFDTTRNSNHFRFLTLTLVGWRCALPSEIALKVTHSLRKKRLLRHIFAYNVSTVRDSEKSSITMNIKSTTGFPTSHRLSAYVTLKCPKGWLKWRFFRFLSTSQGLIVSSAVNFVRRSVVLTSDGRRQY